MKIIRLQLLVLFMVIAPAVTTAAPYSEQNAFCQDYVRNRFFSQYETQKAYNQCMANADRLIQAYEQEQVRREEQRRIDREKRKRESEERKDAEAKKKALEEQRKALEEKGRKAALASISSNRNASIEERICAKPDYPSASRRMDEEGTVTLRLLIDVKGRVIQSEIENTSGFQRLDNAAKDNLSKCQFRLKLVDGIPQEGWTTIKYTWRLE